MQLRKRREPWFFFWQSSGFSRQFLFLIRGVPAYNCSCPATINAGPDAYLLSGYSGQTGISLASQDQAARDSQKILAVGSIAGDSSSDPAGMTARLRSGAMRGSGLPQFEQNTVRKRLASGTLKVSRSSSPESHLAASGFKMILLAWPVPVVLRQRRQ